MKNLSLLFIAFFLLVGLNAAGQLAPGSDAPDFEVDIMSKLDPTFPPTGTFSLYNETSQGRGVCLFFMSSWCSPCWTFKEEGVLDTIFNKYGPLGTNDANVLMIESDLMTNKECLFDSSGCSFRTPQGDWTTVPYTITDLDTMNNPDLDSIYDIEFYPTLYAISPDNRAYEITDRTVEEFESWLLESFKLTATATTQDAVCGNDGAVILLVSGGAGNLQYNWSNGGTTKDIVAISAGSYFVTITDENGYDIERGPFVVNGPTSTLTIDTFDLQNVSCFGEMDGSIDLVIEGGSMPYQYIWTTGDMTKDISGLAPGQYGVTVTDSNMCRDSAIFEITQPAELILNHLSSPERCDLQNGVIEAGAGGGVPPLEFSIGGPFTSQSVFRDLNAGVYTLTVRDSIGCEKSQQVLVDSIPPPIANAGMDLILDCGADSLILDGSLSASGPDIRYLWTTRNGNIRSGDTTAMAVVDQIGTYVLFVTNDATLCTSTDTVIVMQDLSVRAEAGSDTSITCAVTQVELDGTGSSQGPDLIYEWTTLNGNIVNGENSLTPLVDEPGTYTLFVTDTARNCTDQDFVVVNDDTALPTINVAPPDSLTCNNSEVTINAGGSSTGPNFTIQWSTQNGNIVSGENTLFPVVDQPGDYTLTIINNRTQCALNRIVDIVEFINTPEADFSFSSDALTVNFMDRSTGDPGSWFWEFGDGNVSIMQNPTYVYSEANTFEVCLTIVNECGEDRTCTDITLGTGMNLRIAGFTSKDVSCYEGMDGEIDITIEGGVPPYTFNWSNGAMTEDLTGLSAGQYGMTVTDEANISQSGIYFISQPDSISISNLEIVDAVGMTASGSIRFDVSGGTSPYQFLWSNGAQTRELENATAGQFICTITDDNDCEKIVGPFEVKMVNQATTIADLTTLDVYPNPVSETLYIVAQFSTSGERTISILDLNGDEVFKTEISGKNSNARVDVNSLPSGIYFLRVQDASGLVTRKIIVESR